MYHDRLRPAGNLAPDATLGDGRSLVKRLDPGRRPSPESASEERRLTRSDDTLVALGRLLDGIRRRMRLETLAVADESGLLVAGAGAWRACEELAAFGAELVGRAANDVVPCRMDVVARATEVRRLRIDGIEVLLCGRGDAPTRSGGLSEAAAGCERILSRRRR